MLEVHEIDPPTNQPGYSIYARSLAGWLFPISSIPIIARTQFDFITPQRVIGMEVEPLHTPAQHSSCPNQPWFVLCVLVGQNDEEGRVKDGVFAVQVQEAQGVEEVQAL